MIELSIIIPFYRRMDTLVKTFQRNVPFITGSMEVVLVADGPENHPDLVAFAAKHPGICWTIIGNPTEHEWRNPAKAINVGIRAAKGTNVLVVSPETVWLSDVPGKLLQAASASAAHYHYGEISFTDPEQITSAEQFRQLERHTCGSFCVARRHLEAVHGYDESIQGWGADDDNIRARLRLHEIWGKLHKDVMLLHPSGGGRHRVYSEDTKRRLGELVKPTVAKANGPDWGKDFDLILFRS